MSTRCKVSLYICILLVGIFVRSSAFTNQEAGTLILELGHPSGGDRDLSEETLPGEREVLWLELGDRALVDVDEIAHDMTEQGISTIPTDPSILWLEFGDNAAHADDVPFPADPAMLLLEFGDNAAHADDVLFPADPAMLLLEFGDAATHADDVPLPADPEVLLLEFGDKAASVDTIPIPSEPTTLLLELGALGDAGRIVFRKGGNCRGEFWINSVSYYCGLYCTELPVLFEREQIITLYYEADEGCEFVGYTDRNGELVGATELSTQAFAGDVITIIFNQKL